MSNLILVACLVVLALLLVIAGAAALFVLIGSLLDAFLGPAEPNPDDERKAREIFADEVLR